jgi:hypothetical protein
VLYITCDCNLHHDCAVFLGLELAFQARSAGSGVLVDPLLSEVVVARGGVGVYFEGRCAEHLISISAQGSANRNYTCSKAAPWPHAKGGRDFGGEGCVKVSGASAPVATVRMNNG